ncbi:TetR/AcrR family transcriptional regulator [Pseudomonas sp.]|uniref:TetR/AcrR family transcriptional regulator n=1 Tax=Pseudomonas sp. TaxID=306 RepID=UPI002637D5C1|nr:TetR/AcrR family transcriptional regulator [Pseudomonas sp.]
MASRPNLTREDWIQTAQQVLSKSGVDAVRVDTLAKAMSITRGSFYHHFSNREELLQGILTSWRARATEDVILHLRNAQTSAEQQLIRLLELPYHGHAAQEAAAVELGIRAWARGDRQARQAIDEVDKHRLSYIEGLLMQMHLGETEARDRAFLIYSYQLGLSLLSTEGTSTNHMDRSARMANILLSSDTRHAPPQQADQPLSV